ncbi:putative dolichyl-diphosphooligosaccharide--protein glycosyltransferasesubunit 3B [Zostera marina]|uniref:Putative dolichyl-diphosphooligosaccharide--protein glycosyltransferasesubunit 3B n=1 Tax=Zostera marina TaxID=29655 RepID=A0A0K9PT99_ZOSMR|nr:putative dolichyl-diphosphooligosaccharide--protein glycosyltransferasesubunit 3B [Zostera marina]
MAFPFVLFFFIFLSPILAARDDLTSELISLRSQSPSGVIRLTDDIVNRFITSSPTPRPYSFVVFFDATKLHDKTELRLPQLRSEFGLLSSSFSTNNPDSSKIFFCEIEFAQSQRSFSIFGVNSLPHVRFVGPSGGASPSSSDAMDPSAFSRLADSMAEYVETKSGISIGMIHRPPPISPKQIFALLLIAVIAAPFAIRKILKGETMLHDWRLWMAGSVFIYFFSVAGTMHNIIRNMPMFMTDRNDPNKLVFFYQGSGMQLGAEGFAVGFLYTIVGLAIAVVTHSLVYVRSVGVQRALMFAAMVVSVWAVRKVIYLDNWKTGYGIHAYWPSSWR